MSKEEKKPIVIDISNIDTKSVKKQEYFLQQDAFKNLTEILKKDLNFKNKKSKLYKRRTHNTIYINGLRGSGKTQFLLSIKNYIKREKKEYKKLNQLYFFDPIDPTLLHDNESFLTIVIAKILNNLERKNKLTNLKKEEKTSFYKLINELSLAIDGVINNKNQIKNSLENIAQDQSSLKLEEYMDNFFLKVVKILNKKKLVLLIDDIDMALYRGMHVLEVIRKYLSSPYIIPIVTGDENLYETIIEKHFDKYISCTKGLSQESKNQQLAIDYLIKVFPMHRRVQIQTLSQLSENKKVDIEFNYNNDTYFFRCNTCKNEKEYYFRTNAYKIFKSDEAANTFVKNLFSNSLRRIIQFLHKEYVKGNNQNQFSINTIKEIEQIEAKYYLTLLKDVNSWKTHLQEGKNYFQKNEWEKAIKFFKQSIELSSTEDAYYYLGNCYYNLSSWEDAELAYKQVIKLNDKHSDAYFKIGATYRKRAKYDIAEDFYQKSIKLNPEYDDAYNQLGICYIHLDNILKAIENFKKAIELNPNNSKPYINIIETSFLSNKKYYDENFENDFIKRFQKIKNIMKFYYMIKILTDIRDNISDDSINNQFESWKEKYDGIKHPDWSFLELENSINKERNSELKKLLLEYLEKFQKYS